jgi:hypothetical protein
LVDLSICRFDFNSIFSTCRIVDFVDFETAPLAVSDPWGSGGSGKGEKERTVRRIELAAMGKHTTLIPNTTALEAS